jgi:hypothetical protein
MRELLVQIQATIDAIDRAIADEKKTISLGSWPINPRRMRRIA